MLSALRAMWVSTWPTVQSGSSDGCRGSRSVQRVEASQQTLVGSGGAGDVAIELPSSIAPRGTADVATAHRRDRAGHPPSRRNEHRPDVATCARCRLGMIGLGRMGANMVRRLIAGGHECVALRRDRATPSPRSTPRAPRGARSLEEFVAALDRAAHVWIMVPAAFVGDDRRSRWPRCSSPATRSSTAATRWYRDDVDRAGPLRRDQGIHYLDVGTSGGVHGLERGYCLMVGGDADAVDRLAPIFDTLAPGVDAAERTPGRTGDPDPAERGWLHCGPSGAGHFVKMVHNGIEYGLMAAYAEGLNVLAKADIGADVHAADAETAPLDAPRVLPVRPRPGGGHRGVAPGQRRRQLAARPHRRGAARRSRS